MNIVKEKVAEAAKAGQEAAKVTQEYVAAGAHKTQEVFNEYVCEEEFLWVFERFLFTF